MGRTAPQGFHLVTVRPCDAIRNLNGIALETVEGRTMTHNTESDLPVFGGPALRELALAGYTRLEHLTKVSEKELLKIHGVGPKAIRILREALQTKGLSFAEPKPAKSARSAKSANRKSTEKSDLPKLAAPAQRALAAAGITTLEQLASMTEAEISHLHGIGPNALKQLRAALQAKKFTFANGG